MKRLLEWLRGLLSREEPQTEPSRVVRLDVPIGEANRRAFPRMKLNMAVRLQFASVDEVVQSRIVDISRGGVFIRTPQPRPEGTGVRLALSVGDREATLPGVVVRVVRLQDGGGPPGMGVMFTDLGDSEQAFVDELLAASDESETGLG